MVRYAPCSAAIFDPSELATTPLLGRPALGDGTATVEEDVSENVVGDIGHTNPNSPDEELRLVLQSGKDVLDNGSNLGPSPVWPRHRFRR